MKVEVILFGQLRDLAGTRGQTWELEDGAILATLLDRMMAQYGPAFRDEIQHGRGNRILIDGQDSDLINGVKTVLNDGATVVFMPPIAGG